MLTWNARVGAAVSAWRGSRAARALTWLVAVLAGPWCSVLSSGVIDALSTPVAHGRLVANDSIGLVSDTTVTVVTGIVMALSASGCGRCTGPAVAAVVR
ncbi:hypothetical protein D7147_31755 [Micromonospora musae]|uniref:Uncharacterized protein n=1 Tax=Micromonospora musae TaxID=1894970 RepID=A0ABX9QSF7_9ACTN|nr:hypothetical protein D7147_31755 [Micromonospora musae]